MDPGDDCGTIAWLMYRWLSMLVLVGLVAFGATEAHAQVFKPRTAGKAGPAGRTSPAPTATAASGKKSATVATAAASISSKKQTRTTGPTARHAGTTPSKKSRRHRGDDDAAVVDDDDVKITDD